MKNKQIGERESGYRRGINNEKEGNIEEEISSFISLIIICVEQLNSIRNLLEAVSFFYSLLLKRESISIVHNDLYL